MKVKFWWRGKKLSEKDNQQMNEAEEQLQSGQIHVDEEVLFSEIPIPSPPPELITSLYDFEKVREVGSSRFGTVHLLRRRTWDGNFEYFAGKFYNLGESQEGGKSFND
jgi:hypothetical protein